VLALPSFVDRSHGWVAVLTSSDTYQAHTFLFRTIDGGASVRLREPPTFETSPRRVPAGRVPPGGAGPAPGPSRRLLRHRRRRRHLVGGDPGR
jgi:hypothetical protein